jgi:C4-type Zn-finger protein
MTMPIAEVYVSMRCPECQQVMHFHDVQLPWKEADDLVVIPIACDCGYTDAIHVSPSRQPLQGEWEQVDEEEAPQWLR